MRQNWSKLKILVILIIETALFAAEPMAIKIAVPPFYPTVALQNNLAGIVEVDVILDHTGRVQSIKESRVDSPFRYLVPNAEWTAKKWVFSSGYSAPLTITFQYKLLPPNTDREKSEYGTYFIPPRTVMIVAIPPRRPETTSGQ